MGKFSSLIRSALLREAGDARDLDGEVHQGTDKERGSREPDASGEADSAASQADMAEPVWQPIERADDGFGAISADWKTFHRGQPDASPEWCEGHTAAGEPTAASGGSEAAAPDRGRGTGYAPCADDSDDLMFVDFEDEDPSPTAPEPDAVVASIVAPVQDWQPIRWPPGPVDGRRPLVLPSPGSIAPLADGMAVGFQGAWDARGEMIQCYRATLMGASTSGQSARPLVVQAQWDADRIAAIDLALVNAALENLVQSIELRRQVYVVAPIHWTTLLPPFVEALVACLRYFTECARSRWLCLEIVGTPPTANLRQLVRLCESVRGLGRELLIAIGPSGPRVAELQELAPTAIGADYRELGTEVIPIMARKAGIGRTYIWGIDTAAALHAVLEADYSLIGGEAVRPLRTTPDRAEFVLRKTLRGGP